MSPSSIKGNKIIVEMVPLSGNSDKIIDANETAILLAGLITHVQRSTQFNCHWSKENSIIKVYASEKGWPEIQIMADDNKCLESIEEFLTQHNLL